MTPAIAKVIDGIIEREGGFVDHPSDPGGKTCWGITQAVARANGYVGDMRQLPKERARQIYYQQYIVKPGFSGIAELDPAVAAEMIDSGVNCGPARAASWFQQLLNMFNQGGKDYADIAEDGKVGPNSISAFQALRRKRGAAAASDAMLKGLNGLQFGHYANLARGNQKFEAFMFGWVAHRIGALA